MQQKTTLLNSTKTPLSTTTKLLLATGMIFLVIIVAACVKVVSLLSKVFDEHQNTGKVKKAVDTNTIM